MPTLAELLRLAPPASGRFARQFKGGAASLVMPGPAEKAECNEREMSCTSVWTTASRDRQGDIVIPAGVDTAEHRINPVVMYHHGKGPHLPIGKAEDAAGNYTGRVVGDRLIGTTYFAQGNQFAEDVFNLVRQDILRGMSIGFEPVEGHCKSLGAAADPDSRPPLRFDRSTLIEVSHTPIGVNREALTVAVRKSLDGSAPLHRILVKSLEPYALPRRTTVIVPAFPSQRKAVDTATAAPEGIDDIDGTGNLTDETDAGGAPAPTAQNLYDFAQGLEDLCTSLEQSTANSEHVKSKKKRDRVCSDATALAEEVKALADEVAADVGGTRDNSADEPDDMADPEPETLEKADDGAIIVKNYTPRRWTFRDLATAQVAAPVDTNAKAVDAAMAVELEENKLLRHMARKAIKQARRNGLPVD